MLNTLANAGYINRDGRNLTQPMLHDAFVNRIGLTAGMATSFLSIVMKKFGNPPTVSGTFLLCDIQRSLLEGGVEHDASMTREDRIPPSPSTDTQFAPSPARVERVLACSKDGKKLTLADMVPCRDNLWKETIARYDAKTPTPAPKHADVTLAKVISAAETIFLLEILGGENGHQQRSISVEDARSFLLHEKFPDTFVKTKDFSMASLVAGVGAYYIQAGMDGVKALAHAGLVSLEKLLNMV